MADEKPKAVEAEPEPAKPAEPITQDQLINKLALGFAAVSISLLNSLENLRRDEHQD